MELKKLNGLESMIQPTQGKLPGVGGGIGPSFRDTLDQLSKTSPTATPSAAPKSIEALKFSNHAIERMQSRGIKFDPQDMARLNDAVARAAAKGSKDSLILMNDSALIVSVKNKTVVTVMDQNALKENVFTNIDSTIVM